MVRPPTLAVGEDRSASRLELFFDLAYVLVVMQLVSAFTENLTWSGLLVLLGLFVVIWLSWMGFTLYANRFDTDDVVFRVAKLSATLATVPGGAPISGQTISFDFGGVIAAQSATTNTSGVASISASAHAQRRLT